MAIYRGAGGSTDTTDQATVTEVSQKAAEAATSATNAASSASEAATSASTASSSKTAAATSATNAAASASTASQKASEATAASTTAVAAQTAVELMEASVESAESNAILYGNMANTAAGDATTAKNQAEAASISASTYATAAQAAEANVSANKDAAAASATAAATSESNAAASETSAANSASSALLSAAAASTSETNAATSEANAASSATAAASSATAASSSETNAAASETAAASSETNAAASETAAATSASNASTSETNAASSATSASSAQTAAESARDATLAAYDSFDDRYLGAKASAPTLDNDGNALVAGALYFDTVSESMKLYTGSQWVDSYANGADFVAKAGDTMTGNLAFGDNDKAIFGAGSDLEIFHDGNNSYIKESGTGSLLVRGVNLSLQDSSNGENYLVCQSNNEVSMYFDGDKKLATTSTGVDVTGTVTADGLTVDGATTLAGATTTADIQFGDNDKAVFGAGSDLQIYHDGSHSYVSDQGTGRLYLQGTDGVRITNASASNMISALSGDGVYSYYNGSLKLATTATGVDVTGTVTADGLTVGGNVSVPYPYYIDTAEVSSATNLIFKIDSDNDQGNRSYTIKDGGDKLIFKAAQGGDISFYEDTGTTAKFFWDASAESLGIGTSSPTNTSGLEIQTSSTTAGLWVQTGGTTSSYNIAEFRTGSNLDALKIRGDGSSIFQGNVGIGTDSPAKDLHVSVAHPSTTGATLRLENGNLTNASGTPIGTIDFYSNDADGAHVSSFIKGIAQETFGRTGALTFGVSQSNSTDASEAMRIDSSGNLLVGKTDTLLASTGVALRGDVAKGLLQATRSSNHSAEFNRLTSDGDIIQFRKDGTTVGSIGTDSSRFKVKSNSVALYLENESNKKLVWGNVSGVPYFYPLSDNDTNIGYPTQRFKDLYLSGGVYLGGTGSANKLEDYETGTFTPSFVVAPSSGTVSSLTGAYRKIGDVVHIWVEVNGSSMQIASFARIQGLPFSAVGASSGFYTTNAIASNNGNEAIVTVGTSQLYLSNSTSNSSNYFVSMTYRIS